MKIKKKTLLKVIDNDFLMAQWRVNVLMARYVFIFWLQFVIHIMNKNLEVKGLSEIFLNFLDELQSVIYDNNK